MNMLIAATAVAIAATLTIRRIIMSATQEAIDAITAQLGKAKGEILAEIANLEAQVAAGQEPDLTALKAAAQALDDVVPDPQPTPEPAPSDQPAAE